MLKHHDRIQDVPAASPVSEQEQYLFPMSFGQRRLWFLSQLEPESASYNTAIAVRMKGRVDRSVLLDCFNRIVARHEILRTTFAADQGEPVQIITATGHVTLETGEVAGTEDALRAAAQDEAQRPFDLTRGPLLRLRLFAVGDDDHLLVVTLHHIVCDGWSAQILAREFTALYAAAVRGLDATVPVLPIQYADYAEWQRSRSQADVLEKQLAYWKARLSGNLPVIELPTDRPRGAVQTSSGSRYGFTVPQGVAQGLRELSRRGNVTLFMTLLAAFKTFLMRYTGIEDVCVGTPVACRTRRETEDLIGFFANTLVLRTDLSENPSFSRLLERVRDIVIGAQEHQDLPFEELVDALNPARTLSHAPLFQVLFVVQTALAEAVRLPGLQVEVTEVDAAAAKFDLSLDMAETEAGLEGAFEYNTDLFDASTIARMTGQFQSLLAGIVEDPDRRLSDVPLLSVEERREALLLGPAARVTDECRDFPAAFEAQVARSPGAVAVECRGETRTYAELNREADRIAHALTASGIGSDNIVALLLDRGIGLLTAIVGVMKAGGAYLPLDPSHPPARWGELIQSSTASVVLASESYRARAAEASQRLASGDAILLALEDLHGTPESAAPLPRACSPDQLAYVIYTSGSTGRPKGAMVTQRALMNHLWSKCESLTLGPHDVVAQTASACFDISVWQHVAALICGGRTLIVPDEIARDPSALLTCLDESGITVAETVPVLLQGMLDGDGGHTCHLRSLRWMLPTGEALPPQLCRAWLRRYPHVPLVNAYGPAECGDDVATATILSPPAPEEMCVPIGRPIRQMRLVVADRRLAPVPAGAPGELCIGGVGVGRGYLQDPGRTAAAFVPDPFSLEPGARLYRTGDRVRRRTDGSLEFLSRLDHQIKLRGVRIEPGEIDARLRLLPGIRDAVTVLREDRPGQQRLAAYVVASSESEAQVESWRAALRLQLPEPMVPTWFVRMDAFPCTANGKIDRMALPAPAQDAQCGYVAPSGPGEEQLAQIWAEVLSLERVGATDNFFELGGDSILSLQVVNRAKQAGFNLTPRQVFQHQTVAELAAAVTGPQEPGSPVPHPDLAEALIDSTTLAAVEAVCPSVEDAYPLSHLQQGLLFHSLYAPRSGVYIEQMSCRLQGALDASKFREAWQWVVKQHAVLRTRFLWRDGTAPVQIVLPEAELPWQELDWRSYSLNEQASRVQQLLQNDRLTDFDYERPPLMRVVLIRVAADAHEILWTHHHILMDGWCLPIVLKDVLTCYEAGRRGQEPTLDRPRPYRRYIAWLLRQDQADSERFWRATLKGFIQPTALGDDSPIDASSETEGHGTVTVTIPQPQTAHLRAFAQAQHVTLNTLVQGAWALLVSRYSRESDVLFGTTVSGRSADLPGIERMVGLFINTLPLRTNVAPEAVLSEWLRELQAKNGDMRQFEQTPLVQIQGWSDIPRGQALFDSLIVFDNHPMDGSLEEDASLAVQRVTLHGQTNYPLTLNVLPGAELTIAFWYQRRRFRQDTVVRMAQQIETLLQAMVQSPHVRLADLSLLEAGERETAVVRWNQTARAYPSERTVPELIATQAAQTPTAVAVRSDGGTLTYGELLVRANQVAHGLRAQGVGPDCLVGIAMERSLDLVVGLLGILQAGAAYVPLDPSYPAERLAYMLADSQVAALLTHEALVEPLAFTGSTICLDRDWPTMATYPSTPPPGVFTAQQLAYVIYTSGSTGRPKGAGNSHAGLRNRLQWMQEAYGLTPADRVLQKTPISFDVSVWEFFWPLLAGAELVMAAPGEHKDPSQLIARIIQAGVTTLHFVPPMLQAFLDSPEVARCRSLRQIICSGEALPATLPPRVKAQLPGVALHNLYGPTEAAIDVTAWTCPTPPAPTVPIGRPIANLQIYVLDPSGQPVPIGVPGELHIGGVGVGRGYHRRPGLTAERFVPDPFSVTPGQRLYRTGDLVRYRTDGAIEYLGRLDHQVKLRGFRIELGEIEQALRQQPGIREAVVLARTEASGTKRLVGYVTTEREGPLDVVALRQALGRSLPEHMVPAVLLRLDQLPLSPNGKVDRKALPVPDAETQRREPYEAPATDVEQRLAAIWAQVLGLAQVGRHDNFFEQGGDSINSLQILARAHREGITLTPKQLFDNPTIASAAAVSVIGVADDGEAPAAEADPTRIADVELTDDDMENLLKEIG